MCRHSGAYEIRIDVVREKEATIGCSVIKGLVIPGYLIL